MYTVDPPVVASTGQLVLQFLLTVSVGGILTAIANAFLSRKKSKADVQRTVADTKGAEITAASVLTGSAVQLLQRMDSDMTRLAQRVGALEVANNDLEKQVAESQQRERGHVLQLTAYRDWAVRAARKLSEAGIDIDPPPHDGPTFPPLPPSAL